MERKFAGIIFENFGIPHELLFIRNYSNWQLSIQRSHDHSELDIPGSQR